MSTLILNTKSIEKLCNSYVVINKATYDKYKSRTDDIFQKAYDLNIKSYNLRYPYDRVSDEQKEKFYSINLKSKEKFNNPCEILKTLEKLCYNIDSQVELSNPTITVLSNIIKSIKQYIIADLSDYKNFDYGEI